MAAVGSVDGAGSRREQARRRRTVLAVGVVALTCLHLWISRDFTLAQTIPRDQWGYLGNARWLSGDPHDWVLPEFPYFTYGYSLVLVPALWLFEDPEQLFLAIRVTNALLAASVLPLLYLFCRRVLARPPRPALVAGACGALVPPLVAHSASILAENLVLPLAIATVLACWCTLTPRPGWQRLWFAPAMVLLHVTHNRFALAVPLLFVVLVLGARADLVPKRLAVANGAIGALLLVAAQLVRNQLVEDRWVDGILTPQGPASDAVSLFTSADGIGQYLLAGIGQLWYLSVGTLGLSVIGIWVLAGRVLAPRADAVGATAWRDRAIETIEDPRRLTVAFLLASALAVLATSTYFFTQVVNGSEGYIAGRHNDSFVPLWVAAGVSFLVAERRRRNLLQASIGAALVILGLTAALVIGREEDDFASLYSRLNVPAVVHFSTAGVDVVITATVVALGALLAMSVATAVRLRPSVLLPAACVWLVWSVSSEVRPVTSYEGWSLPVQVERIGVAKAAVVQTYTGGVPMYYQYVLPSLTAVPWDGAGAPPEEYVFAEVESSRGLGDRGARLALLDTTFPDLAGRRLIGLWVLPGPEQDRLDDLGALLPPGYPTALPEVSRAAEIEVIGGTERGIVEVDAGAQVEIEVAGRHIGTGSPWPDERSAGPLGSVRVNAQARDPAGLPAPTLVGSAPLPHWVRPGDRFVASLQLTARDADGRPLAPGRYQVGIDLEQVGFGPFVPPGAERAELTMVVR